MKISKGLVMLAALMTSTATLAHPGSHTNLDWAALAEHLISSPYHTIGLVAFGVIISAVVFWRVQRGR